MRTAANSRQSEIKRGGEHRASDARLPLWLGNGREADTTGAENPEREEREKGERWNGG